MPEKKIPAAQFLNPATAKFLDQALQKKADLAKLLKNPKTIAAELGLEITDTIVKDLKRLGRAERPGKMDDADTEVLAFFNKVVADGRYIHEFVLEPKKVAKELEVPLSRAGLKRIADYKLPDLISRVPPGSPLMSPAAIAVVVAAIIVLWSHDPRRVVIDESGRVKL